MPGTLHRAADQRSVRQGSAFVGAVIGESNHPLGTAPNYHPLASDMHQHHLPLAEFALIAGWPIPAFETALSELSRIGIAVIDSDLVAVGERPAQPSAYDEDADAYRHQAELESARLGNRAVAVYGNNDESGEAEDVETTMQQPALFSA